MTPQDASAFSDVFRRLMVTFPKRGEYSEIQQAIADYFTAMKRFPLPAVELGADKWRQVGKHFPKPAEWIESIPARTTSSSRPPMSAEDLATYQHAEKLGFQSADPCKCSECRRAGVDHKYARFVPRGNPDGSHVQQMAPDGKVLAPGCWIHGEELRRWYTARQKFYDAFKKLTGRRVPALEWV